MLCKGNCGKTTAHGFEFCPKCFTKLPVAERRRIQVARANNDQRRKHVVDGRRRALAKIGP